MKPQQARMQNAAHSSVNQWSSSCLAQVAKRGLNVPLQSEQSFIDLSNPGCELPCSLNKLCLLSIRASTQPCSEYTVCKNSENVDESGLLRLCQCHLSTECDLSLEVGDVVKRVLEQPMLVETLLSEVADELFAVRVGFRGRHDAHVLEVTGQA
jgi:hypothetical protein